jgi:hypothetical protein
METIFSILGWGPILLFSNNLILSGVKYLSVEKNSKTWLRGALIVASVIGIVSSSALSGNPIDFNQISDLGKLLVETIVVAVASHYSYRAIKTA